MASNGASVSEAQGSLREADRHCAGSKEQARAQGRSEALIGFATQPAFQTPKPIGRADRVQKPIGRAKTEKRERKAYQEGMELEIVSQAQIEGNPIVLHQLRALVAATKDAPDNAVVKLDVHKAVDQRDNNRNKITVQWTS